VDNRWIHIVGGPLDLDAGLCIGTSGEKTQGFGHRDCEVARKRYPDSWRIVRAIAESTRGIQVARSPRDFAARSPKILALGFASHEVPRESGTRAHSLVEKISAVHLKRIPGASRAISALRLSRLQHAKSSSVIFRGARCREKLESGPTTSPGEVRTIKSRRTRGARLSLLGISLIVISISKGYPFHIRER
jgi:hypothetical protein